jgi:predicted nucleic acid-binding protein
MKIAILDTSAIATWLKLQKHINIFDLLPNIMQYALVPQKVVTEIADYAPLREMPELFQSFINRVGTSATSFFRLCTTIDDAILQQISPLLHVDAGEAEAAAQASKTNINWILIDDKQCLPALKNVFSDYSFHNSITVLSILAQTQLLPEPDNAFEKLNKVYNFNAQQKQQAIQLANKWLGL